jgi:phage terminase large subunit
MTHSTAILVELYKRKEFDKIPIYQDDTGIYYLSPKQLQAMRLLTDDTTKQVGLGGSARCGKSLLLCFWQLMNRLAYSLTRGLIGRLELTNLDSTTGKTLYNLFNFYGLEHKKDYNYDSQNHHKIIFANGSELFLMDTFFPLSDELFTKFGSLELTDAAIDESNETRLGVINKIYSRTGWCNNEKYGLPRKTLETFNPEKNHVYRRFWKPYRDGNETVETKFIKALPTDNPHPAVKQWIEDIIKLGDKVMIERLVHGNFDFEDGDECLCSYDKFTNMFTNTFVPDEGQSFLTIDVAITNDRFVCFAWKGLRVKEIRSIRNVSKPISTITDNGEWINKIDFTPLVRNINEMCDKWKIPRANIAYDADGGLGAKMANFIPGAVAINNGRTSIRPGYKNLTTELGYKLAEVINEDKIYYDCDLTTDLKEQIITECQISLKRDSLIGNKLALKPKAEVSQLLGNISPDLYDAKKYRMLFLLTRLQ